MIGEERLKRAYEYMNPGAEKAEKAEKIKWNQSLRKRRSGKGGLDSDERRSDEFCIPYRFSAGISASTQCDLLFSGVRCLMEMEG
ncbi:MAG: hypothetical protein N2V77_01710 [Canidatus Methanoxibalbensis ujae]|nr:hypothetical protein [Candidatus Methanoxibalbensis ujae]MCW7078440.1 hypothetical protein [Candidatus Methanoxibalbensis ujae]